MFLLAGGGYTAFKNIPIDAFPEASPTQVKIITKALGMTPEEVEARITAPIEVDLLGISHQTMAKVVVLGSARRLRPVMMTASIAAFGFIPLLFATDPGSEIQRPLAIVIIGGLVSSTFLTLFLLPILFKRFGMAKEAI